VSKLPVAEFGVGIEMVFGVMVSPLVSVSASLLSTSSTVDPLSVVRLSAGLCTESHSGRETYEQSLCHYEPAQHKYTDLSIIHSNGGQECR
jgi:hypothetical protein